MLSSRSQRRWRVPAALRDENSPDSHLEVALSTLPTVILLGIFVASAVVIWIAGIQLSDYTDVLAERLHLGEALGGLILLAVATNLP